MNFWVTTGYHIIPHVLSEKSYEFGNFGSVRYFTIYHKTYHNLNLPHDTTYFCIYFWVTTSYHMIPHVLSEKSYEFGNFGSVRYFTSLPQNLPQVELTTRYHIVYHIFLYVFLSYYRLPHDTTRFVRKKLRVWQFWKC